MTGLDGIKTIGRKTNRLLPTDFPPRRIDAVSDHRCGDTVLMLRVSPSETTFHTRVTRVGTALLIGHHAHHLIAPQLGDERTAHATVSAGGFDLTAGHA